MPEMESDMYSQVCDMHKDAYNNILKDAREYVKDGLTDEAICAYLKANRYSSEIGKYINVWIHGEVINCQGQRSA